ncbi:hypothetical protein BCR33DRAFT_784250 [Rhizoclosmatium globosum]|uniref:Sfi1 spindle body domain-containing protein n=1 Tax=Rhizoclosmatium globosum TaxID=329046 RepID=A0A1Y2CEG7_9FUNG|nr:hypothetical protein BCR33DRAFT_784250 [Rhizoclosmatium globosum]|eukprot:ORY45460.1 hypothetical protein BCR33DRAFT_784250 [Rhizoclosmatium globosum]
MDSVAFENLVVENTDDVMIEGGKEPRNLLRQWIENDPVPTDHDVSSRVQLKEPASILPSYLQNKGSFDSEAGESNQPATKNEIRQLLHEIVGIEQVSNTPDIHRLKPKPVQPNRVSVKTSTTTRQTLAQERREIAALQKLSIQEPRRIPTKAPPIHNESVKREDIVKLWEQEVSRRAQKLDAEVIMAEERVRAAEEREREIEARRLQRKMEDEAKYEQEQQVVRKKKKSESVHTPLFSAWRNQTLLQKMNLQSLLVLRNWKTKNRTWVTWITTKRRREGFRQSELLAKEMKRAHENEAKAIRHFRLTTLSKTFLAWHAWNRIEMENKRLQQKHKERSSKIHEFLKAMEEEVANARRRPISPLRPPLSPPKQTVVYIPSAAEPQPTIKIRKGKLKEVQRPPPPSSSEAAQTIPSVAPAASFEPQKTNIDRSSKPKPIKSLKNPDILEQMKQRETERLERRAAIEQKKKERELELQAERIEAERKRVEAEEAERRRFMEQKMEERRLAKLAEEAKAKERERRLRQQQLAELHHKKQLLKGNGITPWRILVELHRQDLIIADEFRTKWDVLGRLNVWRRRLNEKQLHIELKAATVHEQNLKCRIWKQFCDRYRATQLTACKARTFYTTNTQTSVLKLWQDQTKSKIFARHQLEREKERRAEILAAKLTPRRYLRKWREIVSEKKEERSREWRRDQLRSRIKELLTTSKFEEKLNREYAPSFRSSLASNSFLDSVE